jgi:hypothetical protein
VKASSKERGRERDIRAKTVENGRDRVDSSSIERSPRLEREYAGEKER